MSESATQQRLFSALVDGTFISTSPIISLALIFTYSACPGRYFALDALFINVASILHVFNITPPVNEKGHIIKVEHRETDGLMSYVLQTSAETAPSWLTRHSPRYPEDCRCTITPRSPAAAALIREHAAAAPVASA